MWRFIMIYFTKNIESEVVLWFQESNKYLIFETLFFEVFHRIHSVSASQAEHYLSLVLGLDKMQILDAFDSYDTICKQVSVPKEKSNQLISISRPTIWYNTSSYSINNRSINVRYSSVYAKKLIHPKFAHLQSETVKINDQIIEVVEESKRLALYLNNKFVEEWPIEEAHFLQGKFAMLLLNFVHQKKDSHWMAVLHASAVYKKNKVIVFLGESGSGKSTATTLLTLNGYDLLADDFVPISAQNKLLYSFPGAISIKEKMLGLMDTNFPKLRQSELRIKDANTNFKYLYPSSHSDISICLPTKVLVFIKYSEGAPATLVKLSATKTLEYLIPDSWISSLKENAISFLDWVEVTPAYSLEYSDTKDLLSLIDKL
tara:strand:+ start:98 stop:1216 length:1119 start_codon:yes stop_codon:yes gene_type:complete